MMKHLRALLDHARDLFERFADWYWRDPIARQRRLVEEDARRLGGTVVWNEETRR